MNITIHREGQEYGPYTVDEVRALISNGSFTETDFGWHEGMDSWEPLKSILGNEGATLADVPISSDETTRSEVKAIKTTSRNYARYVVPAAVAACLCISVAFFIARSQSSFPVGTWKLQNNDEGKSFEIFTFKPDHTYAVDLPDGTTITGTWTLANGFLNIDSTDHKITGGFKIISMGPREVCLGDPITQSTVTFSTGGSTTSTTSKLTGYRDLLLEKVGQ